jgi:hypothetical protein
MAVNKVDINGSTVLDLTSDTVTAINLVSGYTAHDKSGTVITGTMVIQAYYSGSSAPTASTGDDGDIYFMTE